MYLCFVNIYTVETFELFFGDKNNLELFTFQIFLEAFVNFFSLYLESHRWNNWNCDTFPKHLVLVLCCSMRNRHKT